MTPSDFNYLQAILKARSGLVLSADKQYLVDSRLIPLARRLGVEGVGDLIRQMQLGDQAVVVSVIEAMTTNETFFFRDKLPFEHFRQVIIPALIAARRAKRSLRIWCAACSTGQEPYSLAMILKDMAGLLAGWRVEIVATDLSQAVLEKSKAGLFSQFEVQRGLPIEMLVRHFTQVNDAWQIAPDIRAMVKFRQLNLLQDFSGLGVFDIVFCRNVLIYFDRETKTKVLDRMVDVMERDGFLVLGAAETVIGVSDRFENYEDKRSLYRPVAEARPGATLHALRLGGSGARVAG